MFEIFCNSLIRFNWFYNVRSNYKWTIVDGRRKEAAEMTENWMVFWLRPKSSVPKVSCFGQEKWLKGFKILGTCVDTAFWSTLFLLKTYAHVHWSTVWSTFKRQIWSRFEVRCWTKNAFSKNLQNMIQISQKSNFGLISYFESGPNLPFGTIWKWTKLAFWHVIINCDQNNVD